MAPIYYTKEYKDILPFRFLYFETPLHILHSTFHGSAPVEKQVHIIATNCIEIAYNLWCFRDTKCIPYRIFQRYSFKIYIYSILFKPAKLYSEQIKLFVVHLISLKLKNMTYQILTLTRFMWTAWQPWVKTISRTMVNNEVLRSIIFVFTLTLTKHAKYYIT